jgi:hypothetical protein
MKKHINLGIIPIALVDCPNFDKHKSALKEYCLKNEKANTVESGVAITAKNNLWESKFDFLEADNMSLNQLKLWITSVAQEFINDVNKTNHRFLITESWAHVTRQHGYHEPHRHTHCTWSGIFYVDSDLPASGANSIFLPYYIEHRPGTEFSFDKFDVEFESGRLVLFPSMLMHNAQSFHGNERIVIAFNGVCI